MLTTFDFIHQSMSKDLKHEKDTVEVKAKMSYLANYANAYKPLKNALRKHKMLKNTYKQQGNTINKTEQRQ